MKELESLWKETKVQFDTLENLLVDCYMGFLRKVAELYLQQGRRVFFSENRVVHWGEGNFAWLIIEGTEEVNQVFGDYISEIRFEPEINEKVIRGYVEIKEGNLDEIKYEL